MKTKAINTAKDKGDDKGKRIKNRQELRVWLRVC